MATDESEVSSSRRRDLLVVMPSVKLDSHMQSYAAEAIKAEHLKNQDVSSDDDDDNQDDLMIPPDVLLTTEIKHAEKLSLEMSRSSFSEVCVSPEQELDDVEVLKCWVRANALARIVYGQSHWVLAKTHVQLGKTYLDAVGLVKQALLHANKGCDILSGPDGRVASLEGGEEVWFQLAMAHCVAGRALTLQGSISMAEQRLQDAERILGDYGHVTSASDSTVQPPMSVADSTASPIPVGSSIGASDEDPVGNGERQSRCYLLEKDVSSARARLDLKRGRYKNASSHFCHCIDLTRTLLGPQCCQLIPLLRGLATAEANQSHFSTASQSLLDASSVAEELCGCESVAVAEILQAQGRLGNVQLRAGDRSDQEAVEDAFAKATAIFASQLGGKHEKTLSCKEEHCKFLSSHPESREKAIKLLMELIEEQKEGLGELSVEVGHSLKLLSSVFLEQRKLSEATRLLQEAKSVFTCSLGPKHRETTAAAKLLKSFTLTGNSILPRNHWKV